MATPARALPLPFARGEVPVVLLGGVNLVRCLGLAGIPAVVASADPAEPAFASRHCRYTAVLPPYDHRDAVDRLIAVGERLRDSAGRRVPLMCGSDEGLKLMYAHRTRLSRHFRMLLTDASIADALLDKARFQALAASHCLPVPREYQWDGLGAAALREAPTEVLVKPRTKVDWHESQLHARLFPDGGKARVFANGAEAMADPVVALFHDQLAFQEYIPGDDRSLWSFHGFADEHGDVLAGFVGRKIRTDPPLTGESAFIEIAEDESLAALGRELAARLPLKGPFKMDFKRDPRDGRWLLLEINARFNLWHYLGARNGVNLMRVAYDYLLEKKRPEPERARRAYRWLSLENDYRAFRVLHARGELSWARWVASIAFSRNACNLFAWHDPGPWLRFWRLRIGRKAARASGWVVGLVRQWLSTAS
jgi:predicted ATP-grasp superfamily ATP-dependent carboligase